MRVGLLTADLSGHHGWARYAVEVAAALQRQGAQVTLISSRDTSPDTYPDAARLLPVILPLESNMLLRQMASIPTISRALAGCDVVHSTVELFAPVAWAVADKRPLIHTLHGTYANLPRLRRWPVGNLYARAFRAGRAVCVSQFTASVAQSVMPSLRTHVVPNAVSAGAFTAHAPTQRTQRIVLASGGIKPRKGTLELLQALAVVRQTLPDVRGVIVGRIPQDDYGRQVQDEIRRLGLADHIELTGFVDEAALRQWYASADVFVLPSVADNMHFEGFGLVQLEASAAGLPVITTSGSGAAEAVEDGVTGFVLAPDTLETTLPAAILRLLTEPELAQQMGSAGILKAQRTTWDEVARQLLQVYEMPR